MPNLDPKAAWTYHNATKHSYRSVRDHAHFLDWANQPPPFKVYPALELLPLPREFQPTGVPALSAIAESAHPNQVIPDLAAVSQLLYFSGGITRRSTSPGGEIYFRAAATTGALYEIELYLVCGRLSDLEAGLYHSHALQHDLAVDVDHVSVANLAPVHHVVICMRERSSPVCACTAKMLTWLLRD